jgi:hypothetical protein
MVKSQCPLLENTSQAPLDILLVPLQPQTEYFPVLSLFESMQSEKHMLSFQKHGPGKYRNVSF